ncbi:polysaccharide pyruvyl transferase family protein [Arthrobacter sp. PO-11]|uniref:Polysaccharide pyruvyl transferase family protein n=1 Tax=Arthrobacter cavernae TaxID=2817681 RepID=A0A939HB90_9MICC|nr:polysaccharide pyruvyl transferase family protein [Arthrobacter cavernae]
MEATLYALHGPVTVLATSESALVIPEADRERVRFESIAGFTYLPPLLRIPAAIRFVRILAAGRSLSVIGADLMDGAYNAGASLARSSGLWLAAKQGIPSVLLGCSWAGSAVPTCTLALKRAGAAGAHLNFRDAISQRRAAASGIAGARLTSDIVFGDVRIESTHRLSSFVETSRNEGRRVALVNASGLVGKRIDQKGEYVDIVKSLLSSHFSVILLPHVFRSTGDDLHECQGILEALNEPGVMLVDSMLRPSEIRALCRDSDLVVTGRMHLAVMALGQGVVPITLGTHGKVEGLYQHFDGLDFCVEPTVGFGQRVVDLWPEAMTQDSLWTRSLPAVVSLSQGNFVLQAPDLSPSESQ